MARNLSVDQFQELMRVLPERLGRELRGPVFKAADELSDTIRRATPQGVDGRHELQESIRVEEGAHPLRAVVKGGGPLTTRHFYDYANAVEHGNERVSAQPFFYPTYRLMRKKLAARIGREMKPALGKLVKII